MPAGVTFARGHFSLRFAAVSGGTPTLMQAVTQFSDRYVMAAVLVGTPLAPHLRLPGDYSLPLGSRRRRPIVREGVRESLADLFRQSLTAKGGNRGCWSGCYGRSAAENITDRRANTFFLIGLERKSRWHKAPSAFSIGPI